MIISHAFVIGRYPNDLYFNWHSVVMSVWIFLKWVYYKSRGWHYYMTDFCYLANTITVIFLNFFPKNEYLFIATFMWANGALCVSVGAFRNQMVFHSFDNLSSLALHAGPLCYSYVMKWSTMPYEKTLPEAERRYMNIPIDTPIDFNRFFLFPLSIYFAWNITYWFLNFVVAAKRIRERNYETLFGYFNKQKWASKLLKGRLPPSVLFVSYHACFFFCCHLIAIVCWWSQIFHTIYMFFWITVSIWNSSCFYMDYFSKKYEASLQRLEEVEQQFKEDDQ